jgi:hypothetical protein
MAFWFANVLQAQFDACFLSPVDRKTLQTMLFDLVEAPIQIRCIGAGIC